MQYSWHPIDYPYIFFNQNIGTQINININTFFLKLKQIALISAQLKSVKIIGAHWRFLGFEFCR